MAKRKVSVANAAGKKTGTATVGKTAAASKIGKRKAGHGRGRPKSTSTTAPALVSEKSTTRGIDKGAADEAVPVNQQPREDIGRQPRQDRRQGRDDDDHIRSEKSVHRRSSRKAESSRKDQGRSRSRRGEDRDKPERTVPPQKNVEKEKSAHSRERRSPSRDLKSGGQEDQTGQVSQSDEDVEPSRSSSSSGSRSPSPAASPKDRYSRSRRRSRVRSSSGSESDRGRSRRRRRYSPPLGREFKPKETSMLPVLKDDGDVEVFLARFDDVARYCGWSDEHRFLLMKTKLGESAAGLVYAQRPKSLHELVALLRSAYGRIGRQGQMRTLLSTRTRKTDESLQSLAADIRRLMCAAYPGLQGDLKEDLAKEFFVNALDDRLRRAVRYRGPCDLDAALGAALEFDADTVAAPKKKTESESATTSPAWMKKRKRFHRGAARNVADKTADEKPVDKKSDADRDAAAAIKSLKAEFEKIRHGLESLKKTESGKARHQGQRDRRSRSRSPRSKPKFDKVHQERFK